MPIGCGLELWFCYRVPSVSFLVFFMMDNICFGLRPSVFTEHGLVPGIMTAALSNHLINPQSIPPGGIIMSVKL